MGTPGTFSWFDIFESDCRDGYSPSNGGLFVSGPTADEIKHACDAHGGRKIDLFPWALGAAGLLAVLGVIHFVSRRARPALHGCRCSRRRR
jgi:hypothetical protein